MLRYDSTDSTLIILDGVKERIYTHIFEDMLGTPGHRPVEVIIRLESGDQINWMTGYNSIAHRVSLEIDIGGDWTPNREEYIEILNKVVDSLSWDGRHGETSTNEYWINIIASKPHLITWS